MHFRSTTSPASSLARRKRRSKAALPWRVSRLGGGGGFVREGGGRQHARSTPLPSPPPFADLCCYTPSPFPPSTAQRPDQTKAKPNERETTTTHSLACAAPALPKHARYMAASPSPSSWRLKSSDCFSARVAALSSACFCRARVRLLVVVVDKWVGWVWWSIDEEGMGLTGQGMKEERLNQERKRGFRRGKLTVPRGADPGGCPPAPPARVGRRGGRGPWWPPARR